MLCFCQEDVKSAFETAIYCSGLKLRSTIIWDKMSHGMGNLHSSFAPQHELILFATKGDYSFPGKRPKDVISVMKVNNSKMVHPNEKPVKLMEELVLDTCQEGGTVLDPFMGVGATGVACKKMGRKFIGIELDSDYFEIAKRRIESSLEEW